LHVYADIERSQIGGRVGGAAVGRGERGAVEQFRSDAKLVSEEQFPFGELGGDDFSVEESRDVERDGIVYGLLVSKFQTRKCVLVERTRSASIGAVSSAVLDVTLEELALFENEGRILTGAHGHVEDGHRLNADESGFIVFCLLDYTGDVAAKNGC